MGQVLNYCAAVDSETQVRLQVVEAENEELKKQLLEARERYVELEQQLEKQVHNTIDKLIVDKSKKTQLMLAEKRENKRLAKECRLEKRRVSQIEDKAALLAQENEALRQKLAQQSISADTLDDDDEPMSSTESLDEEDEKENTLTDRENLRNWLHYNKLKEKRLKTELSALLTARSEAHRAELRDQYKEKYVSNIIDDISEIIKKGHTLEIISGLLQTRAEFDAFCIREIVSNRSHKAVLEVAEIICCRELDELRLVCNEYKKKYGEELKEKMSKLSSTKTYQHIINHIFDFSRHKHETTNENKIAAKVAGDVSYLMNKTVKWKQDDNKKKLAFMVLGNNRHYVHDLNKMYFKETNTNLADFVDKKLGEKSTTGHWMKLRIEFCADPSDFYAHQIQITGDLVIINKIFVSNFGGNGAELKGIRKRFNEFNYGDGKTMTQWIEKKCHSKHHSAILIKMLQNAGRIS